MGNFIKMTSLNNDILGNVKSHTLDLSRKIAQGKCTKTAPGSLKYLLWGEERSKQSIVIKFGKVGEEMFKKIVEINDNFELLPCGITTLSECETKKDFDLIFRDKKNNKIYYRELKANIELDTEKLPATFQKINSLLKHDLIKRYPNETIDTGILNWSVYERSDIVKQQSHIKKCESAGVKVDHSQDMFNILGIKWEKEDYYSFFRKCGNMFI